MHSSPPADLQQTDTYFVVAHFHYVLFGGSIMGLFAGIYYYFPKMFGPHDERALGKWHFWTNVHRHEPDVLPDALRRAARHAAPHLQYDAGQGWELFNLLSTIGTSSCSCSDADLRLELLIRSVEVGRSRGEQPVGRARRSSGRSRRRRRSTTSRAPHRDVALPAVGPEAPGADVRRCRTRPAGPDQVAGAAHAEPVAVSERRPRSTAKELGIPMPHDRRLGRWS
jgi:heme/copper-type cytochrome/quinol oxidase subunit 1